VIQDKSKTCFEKWIHDVLVNFEHTDCSCLYNSVLLRIVNLYMIMRSHKC